MRTIAVKPQNGGVLFPSFGSFFDNFLETSLNTNFEAVKTPVLVNTVEATNGYKLEIAAPGFDKEQVKVSVDGNLLTISAEKANTKLNEGENYTRKEFCFTSFKRSFTLPKNVQFEKISAEYKDGILTLSLPKLEEGNAKGKIEIKVG